MFQHTSYRSFLKEKLASRISKNPSYTLRAMAKSLQITPSQLSEVNSGKKNLSLSRAVQVAERLGLNKKEKEYFMLLTQYEIAKGIETKEIFLDQINRFQKGTKKRYNIQLDIFRLISEWYHIAILAMTELSNFEFTPENLSRVLGISKFQAESARERLERLGLLKRLKNGTYRGEIDRVISSNIPNEALRLYHKQMLEKAIESLETQLPKEKFMGTETFSIDSSRLEEAFSVIERFMDDMKGLFNKNNGKMDRTYHLSVQFFNLLKIKPPMKKGEKNEKSN